jgi:hypothetical protein
MRGPRLPETLLAHGLLAQDLPQRMNQGMHSHWFVEQDQRPLALVLKRGSPVRRRMAAHDNHRQRWTFRPQPPNERDAINVRHSQIGKERVEMASGGSLQCDFSVRTDRDAEPLLRQKIVDGSREENVILGNEDSPPTRAIRHRLILASAAGGKGRDQTSQL